MTNINRIRQQSSLVSPARQLPCLLLLPGQWPCLEPGLHEVEMQGTSDASADNEWCCGGRLGRPAQSSLVVFLWTGRRTIGEPHEAEATGSHVGRWRWSCHSSTDAESVTQHAQSQSRPAVVGSNLFTNCRSCVVTPQGRRSALAGPKETYIVLASGCCEYSWRTPRASGAAVGVVLKLPSPVTGLFGVLWPFGLLWRHTPWWLLRQLDRAERLPTEQRGYRGPVFVGCWLLGGHRFDPTTLAVTRWCSWQECGCQLAVAYAVATP